MIWILIFIICFYLAIFIFIYVNLAGVRPFRPEKSKNIFVSVIIPARNESDNLPDLLEKISSQDYPSEFFEVIVVDDNSNDRTFEIASNYTGIRNFKVLTNKGKGKKSALLTGVENASGELVFTTDADCRTGKSWISTVASFYRVHKPDLIIGPVSLEPMKGFSGGFQELEFLSLQGVTAGSAVGGQPSMCNGANLAFTRETYLKNADRINPEEVSGDDMFLLQNIKKKKGSAIMWLESSEATVVTKGKTSFLSFLKQRSRWISKAGKYNDPFIVILGFVTFVTISAQLLLTGISFFRLSVLPLLLIFLTLKSVPDFLILNNTAGRYNKKHLMKWFVPSEIIYPFYVFAVLVYFLVKGKPEEF